MSRAWPFENSPEGGRAPGRMRSIDDFIGARDQQIDAVVVRIGLNDAQLVLVDENGAWDTWVFHSLEEARVAAEERGLDVHVGKFPEEVRVRMNANRRTADDFATAAYPEQGRVGPVIPYPENRPRRVDRRPDSRDSSDRP